MLESWQVWILSINVIYKYSNTFLLVSLEDDNVQIVQCLMAEYRTKNTPGPIDSKMEKPDKPLSHRSGISQYVW